MPEDHREDRPNATSPSATSPSATRSNATRPSAAGSSPRDGFRVDEARAAMIARHEQMTAQERVELFERLSRDAAWARSAKRIR